MVQGHDLASQLWPSASSRRPVGDTPPRERPCNERAPTQGHVPKDTQTHLDPRTGALLLPERVPQQLEPDEHARDDDGHKEAARPRRARGAGVGGSAAAVSAGTTVSAAPLACGRGKGRVSASPARAQRERAMGAREVPGHTRRRDVVPHQTGPRPGAAATAQSARRQNTARRRRRGRASSRGAACLEASCLRVSRGTRSASRTLFLPVSRLPFLCVADEASACHVFVSAPLCIRRGAPREARRAENSPSRLCAGSEPASQKNDTTLLQAGVSCCWKRSAISSRVREREMRLTHQSAVRWTAASLLTMARPAKARERECVRARE
jgi:hypothetical protein